MQVGQRFTLDGLDYYIELIGPVTSLVRRQDGYSVMAVTDDLRRFLKVIEHEHD